MKNIQDKELESLYAKKNELLSCLNNMNIMINIGIKHSLCDNDGSYLEYSTYPVESGTLDMDFYCSKDNLCPKAKLVLDYFKTIIEIREKLDFLD